MPSHEVDYEICSEVIYLFEDRFINKALAILGLMVTVLTSHPWWVARSHLTRMRGDLRIACMVLVSKERSSVTEPRVITERYSITEVGYMVSHHGTVHTGLHRVAKHLARLTWIV